VNTGDIILGVFIAAFAVVMSVSLLVPRFSKNSRWLPGGAPMSLPGRLLLPAFLILAALVVLNLFRPVCIPLMLVVWVGGFLSYLSDRKRHLKERLHG
jgi:hypothetical protein